MKYIKGIMQLAKGGAMLYVDDHKSVYTTAREYVTQLERLYGEKLDFVYDYEREAAFETNHLVNLRWYLDTPVGFMSIWASSIEAIDEWLRDNYKVD